MRKAIREHFQLKQTIVTITAFEAAHIEAAKSEIKIHRHHLEKFIQKDPFFMLTLEPYDITVDDAPYIVKEMARAGSLLGLGPMSAVAGTIAKLAIDAMIEAGADHAVVDNGGDIAMVSVEPVLVGIYAGNSPLRNLALEIPPRSSPLGICTSSGNVGPSISFGCADAAIVISKDVSLADVAATALGNAATADVELDKCFSVIDRPEIDGALIIRGDELGLWGDIPKIRKAQLRPDLITRA